MYAARSSSVAAALGAGSTGFVLAGVSVGVGIGVPGPIYEESVRFSVLSDLPLQPDISRVLKIKKGTR